MRPVLFTSGMNPHNAVFDSITVELRNVTMPYNLVFANSILLYKNGLASLTYPISLVGSSYFISIRSRNGVETWSKLPVTLGTITSFDFTAP